MDEKRFGLAIEAKNKLTVPQTVTIQFADGTQVTAVLLANSITNLFIQGTFQIIFNNLVDALENKHSPPS